MLTKFASTTSPPPLADTDAITERLLSTFPPNEREDNATPGVRSSFAAPSQPRPRLNFLDFSPSLPRHLTSSLSRILDTMHPDRKNIGSELASASRIVRVLRLALDSLGNWPIIDETSCVMTVLLTAIRSFEHRRSAAHATSTLLDDCSDFLRVIYRPLGERSPYVPSLIGRSDSTVLTSLISAIEASMHQVDASTLSRAYFVLTVWIRLTGDTERILANSVVRVQTIGFMRSNITLPWLVEFTSALLAHFPDAVTSPLSEMSSCASTFVLGLLLQITSQESSAQGQAAKELHCKVVLAAYHLFQ